MLKIDRRKRVAVEVQKAFNMLRSFASAFKVGIGEFEISLSDEKATGDLTIDLTDLFISIGEAAASRRTVAIILIDEIQYLAKSDLSAVITAFHKISQRQLPILLFGAGLPQLARLAGEAKSYAERLFDYLEIDRLDDKGAHAALVEPAKRESVEFEQDALQMIMQETERYPFFLQVWGSYAWEVASFSPITSEDVRIATKQAIEALDQGFFKMRFERLTKRQQNYALALAGFGSTPATSTAVANVLGIDVKQAAPIRDEVIKKGMAYSPSRGIVAFTVPKFDSFLKRKYLNQQ